MSERPLFKCRLCGSIHGAVMTPHLAWLETAQTLGPAFKHLADLVVSDPRLDFGDLMRCQACGLRQVEHVPPADALWDLHQAISDHALHAIKAEKKIARAGRRVRALVGQAQGARFLDVGCGHGYAVEAARRLGLYSSGIERDDLAVKAAEARFSGARFLRQSAEEFARSGERFDFIYCSEVIERVVEPRAFMAALGTLAAPGAVLFVTTPDGAHWRVPKQFARWRACKPPEHLVWFDRASLGDLARASGFAVSFEWNFKPGLRMIGRKL